MKITVRKFTAKDTKDWDDFVERSNNGTLFHLRSFLEYHPKNRFNDHSLIFKKKEKVIGVFPAAVIVEDGANILASHPGTSVGSCVVPVELSFSDALGIVEELSSYCVENNFSAIRITQPPLIYSRRISQYMDFAFRKAGYHYLRREVSSILFLENSVKENLAKFKSTHRTAVRKAEKSAIIIRQTEDYENFYKILIKNLSIRHDVSPTHSLSELLYLKELFPNKINLFGAYLKNEMIAGVINFVVNDRIVLAFYISHKKQYQELRPINLLFYKIFDWAICNNFKVFDFGIFTVYEKPNMGLARFKENFGASGVFRDSLELILT
jgi:hypothetical protein